MSVIVSIKFDHFEGYFFILRNSAFSKLYIVWLEPFNFFFKKNSEQ